MIPLKAMMACLPLLPHLFSCVDEPHRHTRFYVCAKDTCATVQSLRVDWKHHPEKQMEYLKQIYGQ